MKRFAKGVGLAVLVTALVLTSSGCQYILALPAAMLLAGSRDDLSRSEIADLVEKNRTMLLREISEGSYARSRSLKGIKEIRDYRDKGYVEFYCGGWGNVSEGGYVGFYYAFDGEVKDCGTEEMLATEADGGWLWRQKDGDNSYFTAPLGDGFYYYEEHF